MSELMNRSAAAARELLTKRAAKSEELAFVLVNHETAVAALAADAYARGFLAGLEHAGEAVRIESEATRGELE